MHVDNELMEQNQDDELDSEQNQGLLKKLMIKLGFSTSKQQQERVEEINHLKFQIQMLLRFRARNVKQEDERTWHLTDHSLFLPRKNKIKQ